MGPAVSLGDADAATTVSEARENGFEPEQHAGGRAGRGVFSTGPEPISNDPTVYSA